MKRTQSGITLVGFIIVLAVIGLFIYLGMKVIPMYSEYYAVKAALKGVADEPGVAKETPGEIEDMFIRRLYISYSDNVERKHVKVTRVEGGYNLAVDYEVRRPLIYNLDIVGVFSADQDLLRGGAP